MIKGEKTVKDLIHGPTVALIEKILLGLLIFQFSFRCLISSSSLTITTEQAPSLESLNFFSNSLILIATVIFLLFKFLEEKPAFLITFVKIPAFFLIIFCLISSTRASYKLVSIDYAASYIGIILFLVLVINFFGERRVGLCLSLVFSFALIFIVYGFLQRFVFFDIARTSPQAYALMQSEEGRERLFKNEVFSLFAYPNIYAAFLVLFLPFAAGFIIDVIKSSAQMHLLWISILFIVLAGILSLWFTSSVGGYVAFSIACLAFILGYIWTKTKKKFLILLILLPIIAGIVYMITTLKTEPSLQIRMTYWDAALKTIKNNFWFGIGLDNFQDYYYQFKGTAAHESNKAHNDYLQIWAELGIFGFLTFLWFWFAIIKRLLKFSDNEEIKREGKLDPLWLIILPVIIAFIFAYVFNGILNDISIKDKSTPILALLMLILFVTFFIFSYKKITNISSTPNRSGTGSTALMFTRIGIFSGVVGFLLHMFVDFDFYEVNLVQIAFLLIAVAILLNTKPMIFELEKIIVIAIAFVALIITIPVVTHIIPGFIRSDTLKKEFLDLEKKLKTAGPSSPREYEIASDILRDAIRNNGLDHESYQRLSDFYYSWAQFYKQEAIQKGSPSTYEAYIEMSISALKNALLVRSKHSPIHWKIGLLYYDLWDFYKQIIGKIQDPTGQIYQQGRSNLTNAEQAIQEAIRLYPTRAIYRYWTGKIYKEMAREDDALREWREAKKYNDLATLTRMKLSQEKLQEIDELLSKYPEEEEE